jgi:hypothetical protein
MLLRRIQDALCHDREILASKPPHWSLTANIGTWKHNVFRFARKRWHKPAEKNSRGASAEELRYYKARHVGGPNPGKGVRERSCKRYRWIGKGGGSRKPVCAGNVETNRHRNRLGAQAGTAPNYTEQPERRNEFDESVAIFQQRCLGCKFQSAAIESPVAHGPR